MVNLICTISYVSHMPIFLFTFAMDHAGFCLYFCLIFLSVTLFGICMFAVNHIGFCLYFCVLLLSLMLLLICDKKIVQKHYVYLFYTRTEMVLEKHSQLPNALPIDCCAVFLFISMI